VLVPVFRETAVLAQLIQALLDIDYPNLCSIRTKICESLGGKPSGAPHLQRPVIRWTSPKY
jgi:hypothetical protein